MDSTERDFYISYGEMRTRVEILKKVISVADANIYSLINGNVLQAVLGIEEEQF